MTNALKLKFSGPADYYKLPIDWEGTRAKVLFAHPIDLAKQLPWFLDYDTTKNDGTKYALPDEGKYILLAAEHESGAFFTTLRPYDDLKHEYYSKNAQYADRLKVLYRHSPGDLAPANIPTFNLVKT